MLGASRKPLAEQLKRPASTAGTPKTSAEAATAAAHRLMAARRVAAKASLVRYRVGPPPPRCSSQRPFDLRIRPVSPDRRNGKSPQPTAFNAYADTGGIEEYQRLVARAYVAQRPVRDWQTLEARLAQMDQLSLLRHVSGVPLAGGAQQPRPRSAEGRATMRAFTARVGGFQLPRSSSSCVTDYPSSAWSPRTLEQPMVQGSAARPATASAVTDQQMLALLAQRQDD